MTDQQKTDAMYKQQAEAEAAYQAEMEAMYQAEKEILFDDVPNITAENNIEFSTEIPETVLEELNRPTSEKTADISQEYVKDTTEKTFDIDQDEKETDNSDKKSKIPTFDLEHSDIEELVDDEEDIKKIRKAADEFTQDILTGKRYTSLSDINSDILKMVESENLTELIKQEETDYTNNSDIMNVLFELADDHENAEAQNIIGVCFATGKNVSISEKDAISYFERAAEQGHSGAARNLAILLENSKDGDKSKIAELYKQAADNGDKYALNNLGVCYMSGDGVKKNQKEAIRCFEKAAKTGDDYAIVNLADCYYVGNGIKRDPAKAFRLYLQAADKGNAEGMRSAAECYFEGNGTKQDINKAVSYFKKAAELGDVKAQQRYNELSEKITLKKHNEVSAETTPQKSKLSSILERGKQTAENDLKNSERSKTISAENNKSR